MDGERTRIFYREIGPPPSVSHAVLCLWIQRLAAGGNPLGHLVLPDGCVDLIWTGYHRPVVAGPGTRPFVVRLRPGARILGVRLRPGAAPWLIDVPLGELLNRHVPLSELSAGLEKRMAGRPPGAAPIGAHPLVEVVNSLKALLRERPPIDPVVTETVHWLCQHPAGRIADLSRQVELSSRQLRRRVRAGLGYSTKTLQRILRFQRLVSWSRASARISSLAALAFHAGFADQAHMTREVRALSGLTPRKLLGSVDSTLAMSEFFKTSPPAHCYNAEGLGRGA